jgi:predicted permease
MVRYSEERGHQFWEQALARVQNMPGVTAAALATPRVPLEINYSTNEFHIDDRSYADRQRGEILLNTAVSPGYFTTLGVRILRGRDFTSADRKSAPLVAIVSDAMARTYWPDGSAVGRTITLASTKLRYEIVGVSADYKVRSVSEAPTPYVHFAAAQRPASYHTLVARTTGDADVVLAAIRRELLAMEPRLVFVNQTTMERTFAATLLPARVGSMLAAGFGGLGTLLAAIGLYGVVAFAVSQRTKEIGIRVALGAERSDVLRMILRQGSVLVLIGGLAGAAIAAVASVVLGRVLYGVGAADPIVWVSAIGVLITAALCAHLMPTRGAMRIDPARTLRDS